MKSYGDSGVTKMLLKIRLHHDKLITHHHNHSHGMKKTIVPL